MIVLDTNVVSALMRQDADPIAAEWLDRQPRESVWTTAITVFEIRFGLELLAPGRRRRRLQEAFARALDEDFEGRVLPFEQTAAHQAGLIAARGRQTGRAVEIRVLSRDEPGMLAKITNTISAAGINIGSARVTTEGTQGTGAEQHFELWVQDAQTLAAVMKEIRRVKGVRSVERLRG